MLRQRYAEVYRHFFSPCGKKKRLLPKKPTRGEEISPRNLHKEKKSPNEASTRSSCVIPSPCEAPRSPQAIEIGRAAPDLHVLPFLLPLLLSPSADTARNRLATVEIDRYHLTATDDRFQVVTGRKQPQLVNCQVAGGLRTDQRADRYVPPIPGETIRKRQPCS
ncbi:hypothetical protein BHE74_00004162 [Ensete ventricosum]|nr:hypothetical protein BHE74_00004162 [Ensete ventricosum]RZR77229.1 hypothetical protein BHM03_00002241 [Ensete ventricosum]